MLQKIKKILYFPVASYFKFWAQIQLKIWKPRIFVITGSSGKTTLLHLIQSQVKSNARFSHKANSSYGIPFDILGLKRERLIYDEWIYLFLFAPFRAFKKPFDEKLYFVEADCDRPGEGKFLAGLLEPEVSLWLNISRSHSVNFEELVEASKFDYVEELIAFEFGYFIESATKLAVVNGDSKLISKQIERCRCKVVKVSKKNLQSYRIYPDHTEFKIDGQLITLPYLLPEDTFYSIKMCNLLLNYLNIEPDLSYSGFEMPPGRSSIFKGIKNTIIVDSSYNANFSSMAVMLSMFNSIPSGKKWAVLSDMTEQGIYEKEEHEKLADIILSCDFERIILMGPRMKKYTYPKLQDQILKRIQDDSGGVQDDSGGVQDDSGGVQDDRGEIEDNKERADAIVFETSKEVLNYLENNIEGGEVILFKGARFLEGVIEHLLADKNDISKLCRRELIWQKRRKKWGL